MDPSLLFPILLLLPLLLLFSSGRRRQKEAATIQRRLAPGAQVVTTAGLYARVVEVEDVLVVLESMKMEIPVLAPVGGIVRDVRVQPGSAVRAGQRVVVLDAD